MIKLTFLIFSFISLYAASATTLGKVNETNTPDYSTQFPSTSEQNLSTDSVGDDSLPKSNIDRGLNYNSNIGTTAIDIVTDPSGNKVFVNNDTGQQIEFNENNTSTAYNEAKKAYFDAVDNNSSEADIAAKLKAWRAAGRQETKDHGYTIANQEAIFFKKLNASGSAMSTVNTTFLTTDANASEAEKNVSAYYKNNFSYMQTNNSATTMNNDTKAGTLIEAFKVVSNFEKYVRSKVEASVFQCYISRELVPAYYCPFPDMTNTSYPDFSDPTAADKATKVSSAEAQGVCNGVCQKTRSCVNLNVLPDTKLDFSTNVGSSIELFPNYTDTTYTLPTNKNMLVSNITFKITITPSADFNGTLDEFETFLSSSNLKFKTSILQQNDVSTVPNSSLLDKDITYLKSRQIEKSFPINFASSNFILKLYKPYIYEAQTDKWKETDILKQIGSVSITEVKGVYSSTDLYFCAYRQLVNNASECGGPVIDITDASSVYHVCTTSDKKIGPNSENGGFYTEASCADACVEKKECLPTYRHYSDAATSDVNSLFVAKVGCVDSDENQACTEDICKGFFSDGKTRPTNEIVVQGDNERVYTVRNKVLTGIFRPKINYDSETDSATTDYSAMFQTEMKDAAYNSMIQNQTFDRVTYNIGTASPTRQAYLKDSVNGVTTLQVLVKPNSFDVDNGVSYKEYSVLKFEQSFRPKTGLFLVGGNLVDAVNQSIIFKDVTYLIKESSSWKVFRQVFFAKVKQTSNLLICVTGNVNAQNVTTTETPYIGQAYDASTCKIQTSVEWVDIPAYTIDRNVFYDSGSDSFVTYSLSEPAPYYLDATFPSTTDYQTFVLTDYLEKTLDTTPGAAIRSQISNNNGASFSRVYSGDFVAAERGWPANITVYNFYSSSSLTYEDVMNKLIDGNIIWDLANARNYPNTINDDTQIKGNNIKGFLLGNPDKTTISLDVNPKLLEEGKRVFKFIFLYNPAVTDPFSNYNENNSSVVTP